MSPCYIFSTAQNNVLAISIFLSFAIQQNWSNLNTIFLDDPVQNLDDINVHSFVDILRSIISQTDKQIFISTHDERVFNFMLKKLRGKLQYFNFKGYGIY